MTGTAVDSGTRRLYGAAALTLATGLNADRAVVVYRDAEGALRLGGFHGFSELSLNPLKVSETLLAKAAVEGRTLMTRDARQDHDVDQSVTMQLSASVSVICLPFYDANGYPAGALYADTTARVGAFRRKELSFARECALWLETSLRQPRNLAQDAKASGDLVMDMLKQHPELLAAPAPIDSPSREQLTLEWAGPAAKEAPPSKPAPATPEKPQAGKTRRAPLAEIGQDRSSPASLMIFFRALATLTRAGVMITQSLALLGDSAEDPAMRRVAAGLCAAVSRGEPLSAAMERYPLAFSPYLRSTIRLGERTGRLVKVLDTLAQDLEKGKQLELRLRGALTYPLFLSAACGLLILLGPPYILSGQLALLKQSGVPLPWYSMVLLFLSESMTQPGFWLALVALIGAGLAWLRRPTAKHEIGKVARSLPIIGRVLRMADLASFARSLSLQLKSGMTAYEALSHAGHSAGGPDSEMRRAIKTAETRLRDGDTLTEALRASGTFPRSFLSFIEAGESSGKLERLTAWVADFYERELEMSLDALMATLEPLLILSMGLVTGVLVIATMKPTLMLLQNL